MPNAPRPPVRIDIVMPALNEQAVIGRTIETLFATLAPLPYRFELIVVDDGSTDGTAAAVKSYLDRFPIRLVSLTRNFGKENALLAGLDNARGEATIVMDADLQHPLELVALFLERWEQGYQSVYAVREDRSGESLAKRLFTRMFYFGINGAAEIKVPPDAGDFRLMDRVVVQALCSMRERVRFTKGLYAWLGFRSIAIPYTPGPRAGGVASFNARRLLRLGWDGLTSFSDLPLRFAGVLGALVAFAALIYGSYIAIETLLVGNPVPGWTTLTCALMFSGGLQLLFLGVLGQYVRNVFMETKQRPSYLVQEVAASASLEDAADERRTAGGAIEQRGGSRPGRVAAA
jgi:glycosyltransferase involved in cell wall biosynthesis